MTKLGEFLDRKLPPDPSDPDSPRTQASVEQEMLEELLAKASEYLIVPFEEEKQAGEQHAC